ncbi:helix-turn-helix domain-containing protein [Gilliamella sp. B2911]|uniref:helix-turn-helix domain-containing protein n=1 Tax=Gilliamella sp. B2911 TaxID=2817980 RepID=UPI003A5CD92B|nr:helix-turn-helix transcriptional regulator [Gilliamella sp. B2911]
MTQDELAKLLNTSISVIGRYERDEMILGIEVAKKNCRFLKYYGGLSAGRNGQS